MLPPFVAGDLVQADLCDEEGGPAVGLEVATVHAEPQRDLVGVGRNRSGTVIGIHHEQVHSVGTDVEDAQAHVLTVRHLG